MKKASVFISLLLLSLVMLFQNCGGGIESTARPSVAGLAGHNYFTAPRPASMCGQDGYNFLMDQYLIKNCGSCHENPPLVEPPFAASGDRDLAYFAATAIITEERWLETTTDNAFCGEDCSLDTRGEVYQGLVEWLSCR